MKWFPRQRMKLIASRLRHPGWVNRRHLIDKFEISQPQASADLTTYQDLHPGAMTYDVRKKRYVASDKGNSSDGT